MPTIKQTLKHRPKIIARNVDKDKSFLNISATRRLQLDTSSNQQNISKEFNDVNLADNSTLHSSNQVDPSFLGRKNQINFHKKEEDKFKLKGYSMYFNNIKMGPLMPQSYYRDGGGNL